MYLINDVKQLLYYFIKETSCTERCTQEGKKHSHTQTMLCVYINKIQSDDCL